MPLLELLEALSHLSEGASVAFFLPSNAEFAHAASHVCQEWCEEGY